MQSIKEHIAEMYANIISKEIKEKWNNGNNLHEHECIELAEIIKTKLLEINVHNK